MHTLLWQDKELSVKYLKMLLLFVAYMYFQSQTLNYQYKSICIYPRSIFIPLLTQILSFQKWLGRTTSRSTSGETGESFCSVCVRQVQRTASNPNLKIFHTKNVFIHQYMSIIVNEKKPACVLCYSVRIISRGLVIKQIIIWIK